MIPHINYIFGENINSMGVILKDDKPNMFYNTTCDLLYLSVLSDDENLSIIVEGAIDKNMEFEPIGVINTKDFNRSDSITETGIYKVEISGLQYIRINILQISNPVTIIGRAVELNGYEGSSNNQEIELLIDDDFSLKSQNPVKNKTITAKFSSQDQKISSQDKNIDNLNKTVDNLNKTVDNVNKTVDGLSKTVDDNKPLIIECNKLNAYNLPDLTQSDFNDIINNRNQKVISLTWKGENEKDGYHTSAVSSDVTFFNSKTLKIQSVTFNDNATGEIQGYNNFIYVELGFEYGFPGWWTEFSNTDLSYMKQYIQIFRRGGIAHQTYLPDAYYSCSYLEGTPTGLILCRDNCKREGSYGVMGVRFKKGLQICGRVLERDIEFSFPNDTSIIEATTAHYNELTVLGVRNNIDGNTVHPDTIQGVGNFVYVGFGETNGMDYWATYSTDYIKLYNKNGELKTVTAKVCGHGLAINHLANPVIEPGDLLILEAGFRWNNKYLDKTCRFRFGEKINNPEVAEDVFGKQIFASAKIQIPYNAKYNATYNADIEYYNEEQGIIGASLKPEFRLEEIGKDYDAEIQSIKEVNNNQETSIGNLLQSCHSLSTNYYMLSYQVSNLSYAVSISGYKTIITDIGNEISVPVLTEQQVLDVISADRKISYLYFYRNVNTGSQDVEIRQYPIISTYFKELMTDTGSLTAVKDGYITILYDKKYLITYTIYQVTSADTSKEEPLTLTYTCIEIGGNKPIDDSLSLDSENAIQNKVVAAKIAELEEKIEKLSQLTVYTEGE